MAAVVSQGPLERMLDVFLTDEVRSQSSEAVRRARLGFVAIVLVGLLGVLASTIHLVLGNPVRALVPAMALPISAAMFWLLRRPVSSTLTAHLLCALGSLILIGSPLLAKTDTPLLIGLVLLPFTASALGGARTGLIWTGLATVFLIGWTLVVPYEGEERHLAWLVVVSTASLGLGSAYVEGARESSIAELERALEGKRRHASERARAERDLFRTRAIFESTFENAPSLLLVASLANGRILDVNECFSRISGWSSEEACGRTLSELNAWVDDGDRLMLIEHAVAREGIAAVEIQLRTKSGDRVWLLAGAKILEVGGEGLLLAQGIDITERKRNERALAHYRTKLEERFEERGEQLRASVEQLRERERLSSVGTLASGIAHQINNPIGGIVAAAQFALESEDELDRDEIRKDALARIVDEAQRCGRIVRNILKFARNEPTAKWENDLNALVRGAARSVHAYVEERGGRLEVGLAEEPLLVWASPIDLEQVVVNLVRNAAESRPAGVAVQVRTARIGGQAVLSVSDDGPGFDDDSHGRAFDPFYTSRVREGGSGLGLSIVHGIVKDHGGQIELRDSDLGGAEVHVGLTLLGDDSTTV